MQDLRLMKCNMLGFLSNEIFIPDNEKRNIYKIKKELEITNPNTTYFIIDYNNLSKEERNHYYFIIESEAD